MGVVFCSPPAAFWATANVPDTMVAIAATLIASFTIVDIIFTVFAVLFIIILLAGCAIIPTLRQRRKNSHALRMN
jgi:hypothetical protein